VDNSASGCADVAKNCAVYSDNRDPASPTSRFFVANFPWQSPRLKSPIDSPDHPEYRFKLLTMNHAYLLQFDPREHFRIFDAILKMPSGTNDLVLHPGRNHNQKLVPGTQVYLWEMFETDLVGTGTILRGAHPSPMPRWQQEFWIGKGAPDPAETRITIRLDKYFRPPIKRRLIQKNRLLANTTFLKNDKNTQQPVVKVWASAENN
jgi:hypothetical protein